MKKAVKVSEKIESASLLLLKTHRKKTYSQHCCTGFQSIIKISLFLCFFLPLKNLLHCMLLLVSRQQTQCEIYYIVVFLQYSCNVYQVEQDKIQIYSFTGGRNPDSRWHTVHNHDMCVCLLVSVAWQHRSNISHSERSLPSTETDTGSWQKHLHWVSHNGLFFFFFETTLTAFQQSACQSDPQCDWDRNRCGSWEQSEHLLLPVWRLRL